MSGFNLRLTVRIAYNKQVSDTVLVCTGAILVNKFIAQT